MERIGRYPARSAVRVVHRIPKDSLKNKGTPETAQKIAAHQSPRTTKLYDRTDDQLTLDEIEKIPVVRNRFDNAFASSVNSICITVLTNVPT
jgi:hypothetical protein